MGLIKIPNDLLKSLCDHVASEYISYLYTFPEHRKDAEKISEEFGVKIDKNFKAANRDIEINTSLKGLLDKIKNSWKLEFGYLRLIIDWDQKIWGSRPKVNASYEESDEKGIPGYFTVNPRRLIEAVNEEDYSLDKIRRIIEKAFTSMWHEATHAVQHNSLKWLDKDQIQKSRTVRDNPDSSPSERRKEYLVSYVEFDPQIKTKIDLFREKHGKDKKNLLKNLAIFVGGIKEDGKNPDEFFNYLKMHDLKRWKKAVNLIYKNYGLDVSSILKSFPKE
jgi:hypothetical protein